MKSAIHLQQAVRASGIDPDVGQRRVIQALQRLADVLSRADQPRRWWQFWRRSQTPVPRGIYLWGGVGRGKTHLCDVFFESLTGVKKRRWHFHRFMREVHQRLQGYANTSEPLRAISKDLAAEMQLLCLDEMQVIDITDAMILHGLLQGLFEAGVVLVTSSNAPPQDLYKNGLQRQRFLPAIALLQTHTQVLHLDTAVDYRLRSLEQAEIYHYPLDAAAEACLQTNFQQLAAAHQAETSAVLINDRPIPCVKWMEETAWFEFAALCDTPRSKDDYIEIARLFHTVLVANVPVMGVADSNPARRFVNMIDEFYDRNVKLMISAAAPPEALYVGKALNFEFERTASRLREMQSLAYLARPHLP